MTSLLASFIRAFSLLLCLVISLGFSGCSDRDPVPDATSVLPGTWVLERMTITSAGGEVLRTGGSVPCCTYLFLTSETEPIHSSKLQGYKMTGQMPINQYFGNYRVNSGAVAGKGGVAKGDLSFVNLGMTEKAGEANLMAFEQRYINVLREAEEFELINGKLVILANQKQDMLIYNQGLRCGTEAPTK